MIIIRWKSIDILEKPYLIALTDDRNSLKALLGDSYNDSSVAGVRTIRVSTELIHCIFFRFDYSQTEYPVSHGVIAHEAFHLTMVTLDNLGEMDDKYHSEMTACLIEKIHQEIYALIHESKLSWLLSSEKPSVSTFDHLRKLIHNTKIFFPFFSIHS